MSDPNDISCVDPGDTTWVLVSTILVLGMMPGLAFFEAGLLRSKNTLSIITQVISGIVATGFMWYIFGYSFTFGTSKGGFIGGGDNFFLLGVDYFTCSPHAPNVPGAAYALFMQMFASITPLLMTGSFAERLKFRSFFVLTITWECLVYYPVAHWIWGGGWLAQLGALDFAGGIVIHTSAGAGALVMALMLGQRKDFDKWHGEFPPSNLPLAVIGAALLWTGWFGFNAGSALTSGPLAASAISSTQIAGCTSGLVWLVCAWVRDKPTTVGLINGVIAGLAGITPASGFISSQWSILVGFILGLSSYFAVHFAKHKLRLDDALDVSSVHGLTGVIGALAIGFFSQKDLNPDGADGVVYGNPILLGWQTLAIVVVAAYAAFWTFIIALILQKTIGLKITEEEEIEGLDFLEHGETAYHNLFDSGQHMIEDGRVELLLNEARLSGMYGLH
eukprot:TRINITY_DN4326_c0_g1_i1.p1 TRINITY_DN4326_c0_g1~~TRINITY_DN4326_c0_g1_i1.p1  ORF type:complete len:447 (+),score=128.85 TRINITY_DN4326_c0_g1_i1:115-1455(+)